MFINFFQQTLPSDNNNNSSDNNNNDLWTEDSSMSVTEEELVKAMNFIYQQIYLTNQKLKYGVS